jgi:2-dehydro-3-deoxyphosphogluconate aldolase / (4S)-4-hydroxy-2-oxoglutarate aldolase
MEELLKMPVVGIVRNMGMDDFTEILPVYIEAGLTTIEITLNTPEALNMIAYANREYANQLVTGAGTICDEEDLRTALDAGAKFIVTPITDTRIIEVCRGKQIPVFPGAFTATEIYNAWQAGASMVKVFPAGSVGPKYIKDIKGPLNHVKLMPTGGVDLSNIHEFFQAGASAAGIGGKLFDSSMIKEKKWSELFEHFAAFVKAIHNSGYSMNKKV